MSARIAHLRKMRMRMSSRPLLILVAGPYRSGTGDDPAKLAANVEAMNRAALEVFRRGHVPITGEAVALPLIELAGSKRVGDEVFDAIFHPVARRLLDRCDGVLRVGGAVRRGRRDGGARERRGQAGLHRRRRAARGGGRAVPGVNERVRLVGGRDALRRLGDAGQDDLRVAAGRRELAPRGARDLRPRRRRDDPPARSRRGHGAAHAPVPPSRVRQRPSGRDADRGAGGSARRRGRRDGDPPRGRGGDRRAGRRGPPAVRGLHEPGLRHRADRLLHRAVLARRPRRHGRRAGARRRGHRGARTAARRGARDGRVGRDRRREDDHAAPVGPASRGWPGAEGGAPAADPRPARPGGAGDRRRAARAPRRLRPHRAPRPRGARRGRARCVASTAARCRAPRSRRPTRSARRNRSPGSRRSRGPRPRCCGRARWRSSTGARPRSRSPSVLPPATFVTHSPLVAAALARARAAGRRPARRDAGPRPDGRGRGRDDPRPTSG